MGLWVCVGLRGRGGRTEIIKFPVGDAGMGHGCQGWRYMLS